MIRVTQKNREMPLLNICHIPGSLTLNEVFGTLFHPWRILIFEKSGYLGKLATELQ